MAKNRLVRGICTVPGCTRPHKLRGYCAAHAQRHRRGVNVNVVLRQRDMTPKEHCSEPDCLLPVKAKGLCQTHYARLLRHGHTRFPNRKRPPKPCSVSGCESHLYANGVCHQHYQRRTTIEAKYGITWEQFEEMKITQRGKCAICGQVQRKVNGVSLKVTDLCVDHCHTTNRVRGLLCDHCNRAIGLLQDDPAIIRRAAEYLERHA